jgi:hypothetical protein
MLVHEQPSLMPMPAPFDGYVETLGRVSSTALVTVARNRYSVPCEWVGQMVSIRLYPERVVVLSQDDERVSHERLFDRGQTRYDWQHYVPLIERKPGALRNGAPFADLPAPLQRLRAQLLKRQGGDRVMAEVLAAVPKAGLEAVLVAVELVLESGAVNAEHIHNVLARLQPTPAIPKVETHLAVAEAPVADAGRYDCLRSEEVDHG